MQKLRDNQNYRRDELEGFIDDALFTSLFPGQSPSAGIYRDNYVEDIEIELMTLADALSAVGCDTSSLPQSGATATVCRQTSTARFVVVAPSVKRKRYGSFPVSIKSWAAGLEHMPKEKRVRCRAGSDSSTAQDCKITFCDSAYGGIEYWGSRELEFQDESAQFGLKWLNIRLWPLNPLSSIRWLT